MKTFAFRMKLYPGQEAEYKRRHDNLWPELKKLLLDAGIKEYHIFLDKETYTLFAFKKYRAETIHRIWENILWYRSGGTIWQISWKPTRTILL